MVDGTAHIGRIVVGARARLRRAAEREIGVERFAPFTGLRSVPTIRRSEREGYRRSPVEQLQPGVELVHLTEDRHHIA